MGNNSGGSKKLYRSRKNRIIGGVLGGLAEYLQVDVVLLRIIYLLLMFFGNFPFFTILYIIGWVIIPEQPKVSATLDGTSVEGYVEDVYSQYAGSTAEESGAEQHVSGKVVLGAILLVIGAVILFKNLSSYAIISIPRWIIPYFEMARALALPVLLIVIGIVLLISHNQTKHQGGGTDR